MSILKPSVRFQNSYRLESRNPFHKEKVYAIMKQVMDEHFTKFERFDSKVSVALCRTVTDDIMVKVKELRFDRYKIIAIVSVCEKFLQGVNYVNKHLWDASTDSNVTYIFDHPYFTAIGICYGIYFD